MGKHVVTGGFLEIGGTDVSSDTMSMSLTIEYDEVESTTFGETERSYVLGLATAQFDAQFAQDYDASGIFFTLEGLAGTTTTFSMRPFSAVIGAGNPQYDGTLSVASFDAVDAQQGDLSTNSLSCKAFSLVMTTA